MNTSSSCRWRWFGVGLALLWFLPHLGNLTATAADSAASPQDVRWLVAATLKLTADHAGLQPLVLDAARAELEKATDINTQAVADFKALLDSAGQIKTDEDVLLWFRDPLVAKYEGLRTLRTKVIDRAILVKDARVRSANDLSTLQTVDDTITRLLGKDERTMEAMSTLLGIPRDITLGQLREDVSAVDPAFAEELGTLLAASPEQLKRALPGIANRLAEKAKTSAVDAIGSIDGTEFAKSMSAAFASYEEIANVEWPDSGLSDDLRFQANVIGLIGKLSNDPELSRAIEDATRVVQIAVEVQDACLIIASAASGWGVAYGIAALGTALSKIDQTDQKSVDSSKVILEALAKMLEYLKAQFLVVNGKLDLLIDEVVSIRAGIDDINISIAETNDRLRAIQRQNDAFSLRLDDIESSVITELNTQKASECKRWAISGNALLQAQVESCLSEFVHWAQIAAKPPFMRTPSKADPPDKVVREVYGAHESVFDAREKSGRGLVALRAMLNASGSSAQSEGQPLANPFVLWTAADGYLAVAKRYPASYAAVSEKLRKEDVALFSAMIETYRDYLASLGSAKDLGTYRRAAAGYEESLTLMRSWLQAALKEAAIEELEDVSKVDTNLSIPGAFGECGGRVIATWTLFSEQDVRSPNPRLPRLLTASIVNEQTGTPIIQPFRVCIKSWDKRPFQQLGFKSVGTGCCARTSIVMTLLLGDTVLADDVVWSGVANYAPTNRPGIGVWKADPLLALSRMNNDSEFDSKNSITPNIAKVVVGKIGEPDILRKIIDIQLAAVASNRLTLLKRLAHKVSKRESVGEGDSLIAFDAISDQLDTRAAVLRGLVQVAFGQALDRSQLFRALIVGRDPTRIPDASLLQSWAQCAIVGIGQADTSTPGGVSWDISRCTKQASELLATTTKMLTSESCVPVTIQMPDATKVPAHVDISTRAPCTPERENSFVGDPIDVLSQRIIMLRYFSRDSYWDRPSTPMGVGLELLGDELKRLN
ncbi:MAG: hypothetical protein EOQ41_03035 [Mesorhizobium sp.]|uniref:hypothetical protein n=1 Tax=Mesorhizobium sp. TaxID=1871066 RepID=UPI000FE54BFB|nr:hypothetical protein [Mesorhizobium sp.]RWB35800.1 MAG: hypothetical protein EOQ41_03035 [Mesorhizobium sp.]